LDTSFKIKSFENIVAIRSSQGRTVGFNALNMEIAKLSEQAWASDLALPEIQEWNQEGSLSSSTVPPKDHQVRSLTINVTQVCNLHCTYCAAGGDGTFGDPVKKITIEKTLPQLDFFLNKLSSGDEFRLTFLGGEPLLYPEAVLMIALHARERAEAKGIKMGFVVVTNGTQFNEKVLDVLCQIRPDITISIDGPEHINDALRPSKGGQGSTQTVVRGLQNLLLHRSQLGSIGMSGVFGSKNMHLQEAYEFYSRFPIDWFDFTYDHLETSESINQQFTDALLRVADQAFTRGGENELRRIKIFDQYFQSFDSKKKNVNFCGAGKTFLMIDARNQIYTCPWVVGDAKEVVGKDTTLFADRLAPYTQDLVQQNGCGGCWARFVCGGGCMFIHKNKTGDKHLVDTNFCNRTRSLIAASLLYYEVSRFSFNADERAEPQLEEVL
jgi:uncharacterized protein